MQHHPRTMNDAALIRAIEDALPFSVYLTKRTGQLRSESGKRLAKSGQKLMATGVLDGDSFSGITLTIPLDNGRQVLAIALTALRVEQHHPFYKEIKAYRLNRLALLAAERLQGVGGMPGYLRIGPRAQ